MTKSKKVDRNLARRNSVKAIQKRREGEKRYENSVQKVAKIEDYRKNFMNGRYFLARYNMMAEQILDKKIVEKIDGAPKTEEYMKAELALMKMQAIVSFRNAHFAKKELIDKLGATEKELTDLLEDYYNGKIIRDDYDEQFKRQNKAAFVNE